MSESAADDVDESVFYPESWTSRPEATTPPTVAPAVAADVAGLAAPSGTGDGARFINRELSALEFTSRVLAQAEDPRRPLLERVTFVAIVSQNLDEFFQVRVAGLHEQRARGAAPPPDNMAVTVQLTEIRRRVLAIVDRQVRLLRDELLPGLRDAGIDLVDRNRLSPDEIAWLGEFFVAKVFRVLTPLAVDPAHPFPYISSLSLNLAVLVRDPGRGQVRFARVKVPPLLPRFIALPGGQRLIRVEDAMAMHLGQLFPGKRILSHHPFRISRNADLDIAEDESEDLLLAIESQIQRRGVFADVVRLEVDPEMSDHVRHLLMRELEVDENDVYVVDGLLDATSLFAISAMDRPDLKSDPWVSATPEPFLSRSGTALFAHLREHDVLVQHPYESFRTTVEAFINAAVADPDVLAIKQTLYRTSAAGGIVDALIRAAESGKQVVALVELKARFDEQANITWARKLEEAGVHVVYGVVGLKTHAKLCLVVRNEDDEIRRYVHVGTGNYNVSTARTYEDLGLFSSDETLAADVSELFNHLTGYSDQTNWRRLLVAPGGLRAGILDLIEAEATRANGRIVFKMNSLVDPAIIDGLYAASRAGADIDLVVRGACCLRPGIPGLSERIRVRSLVGRYLEHSRIFRFGQPGDDARYYIGSADLMPRNLDRRVEALVPVLAPPLRRRIDDILEACLADTELAWDLNGDATYTRVDVPPDHPVDAQATLYRNAQARAAGSGQP